MTGTRARADHNPSGIPNTLAKGEAWTASHEPLAHADNCITPCKPIASDSNNAIASEKPRMICFVDIRSLQRF